MILNRTSNNSNKTNENKSFYQRRNNRGGSGAFTSAKGGSPLWSRAQNHRWLDRFESLTDQTPTGSGFSELDFDLAVTTRTDHDGAGDVELSVLGVDLKLAKDKDVSKSTVSRMKFSVQFSIPQE